MILKRFVIVAAVIAVVHGLSGTPHAAEGSIFDSNADDLYDKYGLTKEEGDPYNGIGAEDSIDRGPKREVISEPQTSYDRDATPRLRDYFASPEFKQKFIQEVEAKYSAFLNDSCRIKARIVFPVVTEVYKPFVMEIGQRHPSQGAGRITYRMENCDDRVPLDIFVWANAGDWPEFRLFPVGESLATGAHYTTADDVARVHLDRVLRQLKCDSLKLEAVSLDWTGTGLANGAVFDSHKHKRIEQWHYEGCNIRHSVCVVFTPTEQGQGYSIEANESAITPLGIRLQRIHVRSGTVVGQADVPMYPPSDVSCNGTRKRLSDSEVAKGAN